MPLATFSHFIGLASYILVVAQCEHTVMVPDDTNFHVDIADVSTTLSQITRKMPGIFLLKVPVFAVIT